MWDRFIKAATLALFRLLARIFPPRPEPLPRQARLILFFSTTGLGDALFDSAAIRSLKMGHPAAKLIVCAHRRRRLVALHNPFADEVVPFGKSPVHQLRLLWRFRRERPDLVLVLHANEEVCPLAYCINRNATVTLRKANEKYAFLAAHPIATDGVMHTIAQGLKVAEYAGGSAVDPRMIFEVSAGEVAAIRARFPEWIDRTFVVFQTGGGRTLSFRDWPVGNYVTVIRWLQARFPHTVILTGGAENMERAGAMERECPGVINLAGRTTFTETAALLQLAALLFTTDTGVMHLGFAVCPHVICLFHHSCPAEALGPLDESGRHVVLQLPSPATRQAPSARDMEGISCDEAQRAIEGILRAAAQRTEGRRPG
jgi:ADP-heptose:LPS heptosyltransferase